MASSKKQNKAFGEIVKAQAEAWSAAKFGKSFLGEANHQKMMSGERLVFNAFEMWKEVEPGKADVIYIQHKSKGGLIGAKVQVTGKNAERLYFAACVDNHLLADWPFVIYEQSDGKEGRLDVAIASGSPAQGGKILAIYENKQASLTLPQFDVDSQRVDALRQAIQRVERLDGQGKLVASVALTVCLFDKDALSLEKTGEYYNSVAQTLDDEDRVEMARDAISTYGMWTESWVVDVKSLLAQKPDKRMAWLTGTMRSATSSPMIPLGVPKNSRVITDGLDTKIAKNNLVWTTLSGMMNYPFLNPSGYSDAQNTRELLERKARVLAKGILSSILGNFKDWKNVGGTIGGGIKDESYVILGSGDRELHLVRDACFDAGGPEELGAGSAYGHIWMGGDIGFSNGQHSTLAFVMIKKALDSAPQSDQQNFVKHISESDVFVGAGAPSGAKKAVAEMLNAAMLRSTTSEVAYFVNQTVVRTSVKWARNDKHSWNLSYESNLAVGQEDEDLLVHQHREQLREALKALSQECQRQSRSCPIVMAKNHQTQMAAGFGRDDVYVQLPEAIQWMAADQMFKQKKWGSAEKAWTIMDGTKIKDWAVNKEAGLKAVGELVQAAGASLSELSREGVVKELFGYQVVYKTIFSSSKAEREVVYKGIKKMLMAGDHLTREILEAQESIARDRALGGVEGKEDVLEFSATLRTVLDKALNQNLMAIPTANMVRGNLDYQLEAFKSGDITLGALRRELNNYAAQMCSDINKKGCNPGPLHAAAICAQALNDFKMQECEKRIKEKDAENRLEAEVQAKAEGREPKYKKLITKKMKFSEVLSQEKYSFWAKEASFDMLVAASLAKTFGTVLGEGVYKIEPEKDPKAGEAWPERLAKRVKEAAKLALEKSEILTALANKKEGALVSHLFRHGHGALRLIDASAQPIANALAKAGVPTNLIGANYYEWLMNAARPAGLLGACSTDPDANVGQWVDEAIVPGPPKPLAGRGKGPKA